MIDTVIGVHKKLVRIELDYDGLDFDDDVIDFYVDIASAVLKQTGSGELPTDSLSITAYIETPVASLTPLPALHEYGLDTSAIIVNLTEERFSSYLSLSPASFTLYNTPSGISIQSVQGNTPTSATVNLAFDGRDFDVNYPDFTLEIAAAALVQTESGVPAFRLPVNHFLRGKTRWQPSHRIPSCMN